MSLGAGETVTFLSSAPLSGGDTSAESAGH